MQNCLIIKSTENLNFPNNSFLNAVMIAFKCLFTTYLVLYLAYPLLYLIFFIIYNIENTAALDFKISF